MPALAVTLPAYHIGQDLQDADSPVDRQLASALASTSVILSVLRQISFDETDGAVKAGWDGNPIEPYAKPTHISAGGDPADQDDYEGFIDAAYAAAKALQAALLAVYKK